MEKEKQLRFSQNQLKYYKPYPKQKEFHDAGALNRERLLLAGNQLGKTLSAGAETAMHLTGRYPDWWKGRVFDTPTQGWASGVTGESTRDNPQRILYGKLGEPGTGMLPKDAIYDVSPRRGLPDAVDTILVRWGGGGDVQTKISQLGFKSNDQGREKWQGATLHWVWLDEEHDMDVYGEAMTRLNVFMGLMIATFTPLKGMTKVVERFLFEKPPGTHITQMTIEEALHYSPEQRTAIIAGYQSHEREARAKGIPMLGSGAVFPVPEEYIKIPAFDIPAHWPQICGIDFGWDHPSGASRLAWDRDNDIIYVIACHQAREQTPAMFVPAVKPWGHWLKWAWPHDGLQHDKGSGEQLAQQYEDNGLAMLPERATFEDGSFGVEAGITEMLERMQTGRLKVFSHLNDWFKEFRIYHRKNGLIVKLNDDIISATRYALMMRRFATLPVQKRRPINSEPPGSWMA